MKTDGKGGVCGMETIAEVPGRQVYLFGKGGEIEGQVVDADLHDELHRANPQELPLDLEIMCPRCGAWHHIDGHKKQIHARYLDQPRKFTHPKDGDLCVQTAVVTISEELECPEPVGKGRCGLRFKITANVMHQV